MRVKKIKKGNTSNYIEMSDLKKQSCREDGIKKHAVFHFSRPSPDHAELVERLNEKALELLEHRHATAGWLMQEAADALSNPSPLGREDIILDALKNPTDEMLEAFCDTYAQGDPDDGIHPSGGRDGLTAILAKLEQAGGE